MQDLEATIASQFANSPTLLQLIQNFNTYVDPTANLDAFVDYVWNVETAQGFALDIWGRIVGVTRNIPVGSTGPYLGFEGDTSAQPFGQAPMFAGAFTGGLFQLSDSAFRTLIYVKALSNISNCTPSSYNQLLDNLFESRGSCWCADLGNMTMRYVFLFTLEPYEISIIVNSGALPRPAGVLAQIYASSPPATTLGFNGTGFQPFGQGTLSSTSQFINLP
jgi:hypothetical protein